MPHLDENEVHLYDQALSQIKTWMNGSTHNVDEIWAWCERTKGVNLWKADPLLNVSTMKTSRDPSEVTCTACLVQFYTERKVCKLE